MDVILRDSYLDTRIRRYILLNMIVPKLDYAGAVWEGSMKLAEKLETVQMAAAKKILGSSKTINTALRAELGMYALKQRHENPEMAIWRKKHAEEEVASYS